MIAADVARVLDAAGVQFALIGAMAVAARGHPRFTADYDFLTTDKRVFDRAIWEEIPGVDIRKGDYDDPLAGVVRIGSKPNQVDVVVGKWKWEQEVIERAQRMDIGEMIVPVPSRADLILLKIAAGGTLDYRDAFHLLQLGPRAEIVAHIDGIVSRLPKEAQQLWQQLLRDTATS